MKLVEFKPSPNVLGPKERPGQRLVGRTEEGKKIAVPHTPYEIWIDPQGHVVQLPVRTARMQKDERSGKYIHGDDSAYIYDLKQRKTARGWLPYAFDSSIHPAKGYLSRDDWESKRDGIIEARRKKSDAESAPYRMAWEAQDQRKSMQNAEAMKEAFSDFTDKVQELSQKLSEKPARGPGRPPKDE